MEVIAKFLIRTGKRWLERRQVRNQKWIQSNLHLIDRVREENSALEEMISNSKQITDKIIL